jgi:flagellar basal body-associated protein FliL
MRSPVRNALICFRFNDDPGSELTVEPGENHFTDEITGDLNNILTRVK